MVGPLEKLMVSGTWVTVVESWRKVGGFGICGGGGADITYRWADWWWWEEPRMAPSSAGG